MQRCDVSKGTHCKNSKCKSCKPNEYVTIFRCWTSENIPPFIVISGTLQHHATTWNEISF